MSILAKTSQCVAHGYYIGRECPICGPAVASVLPDAAATTATTAAGSENWHRGAERDLHDWMEAEMMRLGVSYIHGRMDVKSTIRNGWPDFSLFRAGEDGVVRACFVELKNRAGKTSAVQREVIAEMEGRGLPVLVTGDFREAVEFVKKHLKTNEL
jgi:hypothetical protein